MRIYFLSLLLVSNLLTACAAGSTAGQRTPVRDTNQITSQELQGSQYQNAFDLIQATRPRWLQPRGPQSFTDRTAGEVMVYLDGTRIGGKSMLRRVLASDMDSAQYLNASEVAARYGLNHSGGAILIITRRSR